VGGLLAILAARLVGRPGGLPPELAYLTITSKGLSNDPPASVWLNLRRLSAVLSSFARHAGPIVVTSGYRSPAVNRAVGGVPDSLHMQGRAADIQLDNPRKTQALFDTLRSDPAVLAGVVEELILYLVDGSVSHLHIAIPIAGLEPTPTIQITRRSGGQTLGDC